LTKRFAVFFPNKTPKVSITLTKDPFHPESDSLIGKTVDMMNEPKDACNQRFAEFTLENPQTCHTAADQNQINDANTVAGMGFGLTNGWNNSMASYNDQEVNLEFLDMLDYESVPHMS
jgi:hypothetical protein